MRITNANAVSLFYLLLILSACGTQSGKEGSVSEGKSVETAKNQSIIVLGTTQDAGSPQIGCNKNCCKNLWVNGSKRLVTSLGVVDFENNKSYLFDASPDFKKQTTVLSNFAGNKSIQMPDGIFLTHGHIGHYSGLMQLGREAIGSNKVPVFAMPRMKKFLENNGPWSQLVELKNIVLQPLKNDSAIALTNKLQVTPFLVPHRGEYTETVGYKIEGPQKSALFIPDIDKWDKWNTDILEQITKVDFAFLDATFFKNGEVGNRDMSEIPHPFVEESMNLFENLPKSEKDKIYFIHFNHTNPLLDSKSEARTVVEQNGFHIAEQGMTFEL